MDRQFPNLPARDREQLAMFLNLLADAPPFLLEEMKRTRPPGMSARDFDLLVGALRGMQAPPVRNKALPPPPPPDPNQPELF